MFGHQVQMNFNKRGPEHTTALGGVVTIVVQGVILAYVALLFRRMLRFEDD